MYSTRIPREKSALIFILKGLIPYTEANIMLAFKPSLFFSELSKISRIKQKSLEAAMFKAEQEKLIQRKIEQGNNLILITDRGRKLISPFIAEKLKRNAKLMIVFDIPEGMSTARNRLRRVLRAWRFEPVQKSVWVTSYNHRQSIKELIKELEIEPYVQLFECSALTP